MTDSANLVPAPVATAVLDHVVRSIVDNQVGAAGATGVGELVMKTLTSFTIVELMRQGRSPQEACREAFERMCALIPEARTTQEAFIAINKQGEAGCATNSNDFVFYYSDGTKIQRNKPVPIL